MSMRSGVARPVVKCGPGRVKQEFGKRSDIREIVRKYRATGQLESLKESRGVFGDVSAVPSYHEMAGRVAAAREAFEGLPANVRRRFANDPGNLIAFLQDERNREEAIKLGLVDPPKPAPKEPEPTKVVIVEGAKAPESPK